MLHNHYKHAEQWLAWIVKAQAYASCSPTPLDYDFPCAHVGIIVLPYPMNPVCTLALRSQSPEFYCIAASYQCQSILPTRSLSTSIQWYSHHGAMTRAQSLSTSERQLSAGALYTAAYGCSSVYTVQRFANGSTETLEYIAQKHSAATNANTTAQDILDVNPWLVNTEQLYPEQTVSIPPCQGRFALV